MSIIIRPVYANPCEQDGRYYVQIRLGDDVAAAVCESFDAALSLAGINPVNVEGQP